MRFSLLMGNSSSQVEPVSGLPSTSVATPPRASVAQLDDPDELAASQLYSELQQSARGRIQPPDTSASLDHDPPSPTPQASRSLRPQYRADSKSRTSTARLTADKLAATSTNNRVRTVNKRTRPHKTDGQLVSPPPSSADNVTSAMTDDVVVPNTQLDLNGAVAGLGASYSQTIPTSSAEGRKSKRKRKDRKTEVTVDLSDAPEDDFARDTMGGADEEALATAKTKGSKRSKKQQAEAEAELDEPNGIAEGKTEEANGDVPMPDIEAQATQQKKRKRTKKSEIVDPVGLSSTQAGDDEAEAQIEDASRPSKKRKAIRKSRKHESFVPDNIRDRVDEAAAPGDVQEEETPLTNGEGNNPHDDAPANASEEPILPSSLLRRLKSKKNGKADADTINGVPLDEKNSAYDEDIGSQLEAAARHDEAADAHPNPPSLFMEDDDDDNGAIDSPAEFALITGDDHEKDSDVAVENTVGLEPGQGGNGDQHDAEQKPKKRGARIKMVKKRRQSEKTPRKKGTKGKGPAEDEPENTPAPKKKRSRQSSGVNLTPNARARGAEFELANTHRLSDPLDLRETGEFSQDEAELVRRKIEEQMHMHDLEVGDLVRLVQWTAPYKGQTTTTEDGDHKELMKASSSFWSEIFNVLPNRKSAKAKGGTTSIKRFVRRKYHGWVKGHGGWTEEEDEKLKRLYALHPNEWTRISLEIDDRSADACRDRWRDYGRLGENRMTNHWQPEEEGKLRQIVEQALDKVRRRRPPPADYSSADISWPWVSEQMGGTRSRIQCLMKWKSMQEKDEREQTGLPRPAKKKKRVSKKGTFIADMETPTSPWEASIPKSRRTSTASGDEEIVTSPHGELDESLSQDPKPKGKRRSQKAAVKEEDAEGSASQAPKAKRKRNQRKATANAEDDVNTASTEARKPHEFMLPGDVQAVVDAVVTLGYEDPELIDWNKVADLTRPECKHVWSVEACKAAFDELAEAVGPQDSFNDVVLGTIDLLQENHSEQDLEQLFEGPDEEEEEQVSQSIPSSKSGKRRRSGGSQTSKRFTSANMVTASDDEL